ncbi:MAG: two-component system response regulator NarL [Burkholderiales bacterium]|nr:two-component system response regulator NarL [Burkholderiales bacterium]
MTDSSSCNVLVVDDHPLFRKGVVQLLQLDPMFHCAGEAGTYDAAMEGVRKIDPDLVLLDLNMKGTSGIEILSAIKKHDPGIKVIMLTVSDSPSDLLQAIRSGADGYLLKDLEPSEILESLKRAVEGVTVLSPSLMSALASVLKQDSPSERSIASLTDRERAVLKGISSGQSNKVIARNLGISDGTVKVHVKHVLKKLNFRSRVEAAIWVKENDIQL